MVGFTKKHSPIVTQFLRHGTAVMVFPHFQTPLDQLKIRKKVLLDAKRTYQSRLIKEQNPQFEFYGRWAMEIMNALDDGIKRRVIEKLPHRMEDLSYDLNTKDGHKIEVIIKKIDKKSVVMIQFFPQGVQR